MEAVFENIVTTVFQFTEGQLVALLETAKHLEEQDGKNLWQICCGQSMAIVYKGQVSVFVKSVYSLAMSKLGGSVVDFNTDSILEFPSSSTTDQVEDMRNVLKSLCSMYDVVVASCSYQVLEELEGISNCRIIWTGEDLARFDSLQALSDIYVMSTEQDTPLQSLHIVLVGSMFSHVEVHNLVDLLAVMGARVEFVGPEHLKLPTTVQHEVQARCPNWTMEYGTLERNGLSEADVIVTCPFVQSEFETIEGFRSARESYSISPGTLGTVKPTCTFMTALYGDVSLYSVECTFDPRFACSRQAKRGQFVRMSLLSLLLKKV